MTPRLLLFVHPDHHDLEGLAPAVGQWVLAGARVGLLPSDDLPADQLAALLEDQDLLVAVGGDGTVHAAVAALVAAGACDRVGLAVVPAGTGNDLAAQIDAALGRRGRALDRITAWISGQRDDACLHPVDLVRCRADGGEGEGDSDPGDSDPRHSDPRDSEYIVNVLSMGPAAEMTASTPDGLKQTLGPLAYLAHGLANLDRLQAFPVELDGDGCTWSGDALGVFVANGSRAGGGMTIAGSARVDSGCMLVVVVPDLPLGALTAVMGSGLAGAPEAREELVVFSTRSVTVRTPGGVQANLDGESRVLHRARLTLLPAALQLLGPAVPSWQVAPG